MKSLIRFSFLLCLATVSFGQVTYKKIPLNFRNPIIVDSTSTLFIPVSYNTEMLSDNKIALGGDYYANIVAYNFKTDTSKILFKHGSFIEVLLSNYSYTRLGEQVLPKLLNVSNHLIFYFVKHQDYDTNGRIDSDDPSILYVSDRNGNHLQALTPENENAVSLNIFDKQGFALIKMQRDSNNSRNFNFRDQDVYYVKLDLKSLALGNKIELKYIAQTHSEAR